MDEGLATGPHRLNIAVTDQSNSQSRTLLWTIHVLDKAPLLNGGPADGATGVSLQPTFAFSTNGVGGVLYWLAVMDDASGDTVFSAPIFPKAGTSYSLQISPSQALEPNTAYRWMVAAFDSIGWEAGMALSQERTFATGQGGGSGGSALRIGDVAKAEGNAGASAAVFAVTLTPASAGTVTVNYATANGTALAGSDYTAASGVLTFAPGQTSKTVSVNVTGDAVSEPNETFVVNLSAPSGATLFDGQGLGTVLNDEGPVLRITDVAKAEGNAGASAAVFAVTLTPASAGTVTVNYATANGTALAGSDYTAASGVLTFAPGQTSKTVSVNVTGDAVSEPNETFVVNLSAPSGATLFDGQGLGTVLDTRTGAADYRRGQGRRQRGRQRRRLRGHPAPASAGTVTVNYATANGTALAGSDYTAASGVLTFAPGQTSKTVSVDVTGDAVSEHRATKPSS